MIDVMGTVFTVVVIIEVMLRESEDPENALVRTGFAAVENVVVVEDSVMDVDVEH